MTSINTKKWAAWINTMPLSEHKLIVTGEVETNAGNMVPVLSEAVPQGFNPQILILELNIVQKGDVGTKDIAYRDVRFEKPAESGDYMSVNIRYGADIIADIPVAVAS